MAERLVIDRRPASAVRQPDRLVVFFHGFMTTPTAYRTVLGALADERTVVVAPRMYRPGPAALAGHPTATQEAAVGASIVDELRRSYSPAELWLAGHSRGGQVAWIVAGDTTPDGLIVVDPVDGGGPKATRLNATATPSSVRQSNPGDRRRRWWSMCPRTGQSQRLRGCSATRGDACRCSRDGPRRPARRPATPTRPPAVPRPRPPRSGSPDRGRADASIPRRSTSTERDDAGRVRRSLTSYGSASQFGVSRSTTTPAWSLAQTGSPSTSTGSVPTSRAADGFPTGLGRGHETRT